MRCTLSTHPTSAGARRRLLAAIGATALLVSACAGEDADAPTDDVEVEDDDLDDEPDDGDADDADEGGDADADDVDDADAGEDAFPATVTDSRGVDVEIAERPERIVSLSPTHTEILFAIGADEQVHAVDDQSDYPDDAPITDLSGFEPNIEAIADEDPDLVIAAFDPGGMADDLEGLGIDVLIFDTATNIDEALEQYEATGVAVGHADAGEQLATDTREDMEQLAADAPEASLAYYHELDEFLYTATSQTFIGEVYGLFGLENVADPADEDGSGFPQLSEEYIVEENPDLIFLAGAGASAPDEVADRPGWDTITAVQEGNLIEVDSDIASRWGPRIVEFAETVRDAMDDAA